MINDQNVQQESRVTPVNKPEIMAFVIVQVLPKHVLKITFKHCEGNKSRLLIKQNIIINGLNQGVSEFRIMPSYRPGDGGKPGKGLLL